MTRKDESMIVTSSRPSPGTQVEFAIVVQGSDVEALSLIRLLKSSARSSHATTSIKDGQIIDLICKELAAALGKPAIFREPSKLDPNRRVRR